MFDNIASFDIGSSSIKLIKAKRGIKNFEILSTAMESIDQEVHIEDQFAAIEKALNVLIEREDIDDCKTVISVQSDRVLLRNIEFPFSEVEKIATAVPFEAEEAIPYPVDMVYYDYQHIANEQSESGSVIIAAIEREYLKKIIDIFNSSGIYPLFAGIESNSLLKCYEYFNSVNDESIIQIDIGNRKTTINIVKNSKMIFTRAVTDGVGVIIDIISEMMKVGQNEAYGVFSSIDLDLASFESTIQNGNFKDLNIARSKLKTIFMETENLFLKIMEEVAFTVKSSREFNDFSGFNRIIITGGGSNIKGVSRLIGDYTGLPVVFMPFLQGYTDPDVKSRFSISFGNMLVYMNYKSDSINFLKGEFISGDDSGLLKKYYLPVIFASLTILILVINIVIFTLFSYKNNSYTKDILQQKYRKYFDSKNIPDDPLKEAKTILSRERKELNVLKELLGEQTLFIPYLNKVIKSYPGADGFFIKKLSYDGKNMVIDGETGKASDLEEFKKNLLESGDFESVTVNIKDTSSSRSLFSINIKQKLQK